MADQQENLAQLSDLLGRIDTLHSRLDRLELGVNAQLRGN